jgi:indole-3-glycerol phosphate synthase
MSWLDDYLVQLRSRNRTERAGAQEGPARDFLGALRAQGAPAVIAEIKFRSPSRGLLRPAFDVEAVAAGYARAGAAALSVLVDGPHFGGQLDFLRRARGACDLPLLAKGFFVDAQDLREVRAAGADALLLIARCLHRLELVRLHDLARELGMAALVELHGEADLDKVAGLHLPLVGVNHRDLDTLELDLGLTRRLGPRLPPGAFRVAESGLSSRDDLARMASLGYGAVLMGTGFMSHPDPGAALADLLGTPC